MASAALAVRFGQIIDLLCRVVAARGGKGALPAPLGMLLWTRLRRAAARFEILADRIARNAPPLRPRRRSRRAGSRRTGPHPEAPILPRRVAWLLCPVPEAAAGASQLRHFLADPELEALIAADHRFGRILRPLCRHLGVALPPCLRTQPRPNAPSPSGAAPHSKNRKSRRAPRRRLPFPAAALGLAVALPPARPRAIAADPARAPPYPL